MHKEEEGSIYSLETINNGPSCKNGEKPYLKCTMTDLYTTVFKKNVEKSNN
jgi:hypothetical protein